MRQVTFVVASMVAMFSAGVARGVTYEPKAPHGSNEPLAGFTTNAAVRAQTDVQIRRLHNLIVNKSDDASFDKLEKLQKQLRGAK